MSIQSERIRDELLVMGCQQGDEGAFSALVVRWQERLWRHARRLTEDEDAAYDVLQEAWLAIGKGLPRLHDAGSFPAWAYRIVTNKCRDWLRRERRRKRRQELYADAMPEAQFSDTPDCGERVEDLREAMRHLPGPDRALLALKYEEGFNTAAIADVLGIPEGTVRSRLNHARNRLKALMEGRQT